MTSRLTGLLLWTVVLSIARGDGLVWRLDTDQSTVFFVGSCHVLKKSDYPLPSEYETAYIWADEVYFEADLEKLSSRDFQLKMLKKAMFGPGEGLSKVLDEETYALLQAYCKETGRPIEAVEPMKPWMLCLTLLTVEMQKHGITPDAGVDMHFYQKAKQDEKPIHGLETPDEHLEALAVFDDTLNDVMVKDMLENVKTLSREIDMILNAWRKGDTKTMARLLHEEMMKEAPALYRTLVVERNRNWIPKIEAGIRSGKDLLFVVGAAHLAGKDSVIRMLEKKGYTLKRYAFGAEPVESNR